MKKAVLVLALALLAVAMLATPVFAIGPMNAGKSSNPNFVFTGYGVQIRLPPGQINEWVNQEGDVSHVQIKRATEFQMENVFAPSSVSEIQMKKWNFLSEDVFEAFLISVGFPPGMAPGQAGFIAHIAAPGGVYYKEVYIGKP